MYNQENSNTKASSNNNKSFDVAINPAMHTFTSNFSGAYSATSGGSVPRRKRQTDRFVKYPYPKNMISNYQKEFHSKMEGAHFLSQKDAFNHEKEHKILNPHKMDCETTNHAKYQPFQVKPNEKKPKKAEQSDAPCNNMSIYRA
jgi:hypothetical protein